MKKGIGLILTVAIVLNSAGVAVLADPGRTSAEEVKLKEAGKSAPQDLERVIKAVKSKIDIPAEYTEFSSNINSGNFGTTWRFQWSSKQDEMLKSGGSIEVMADSRGNITSYNHYKYDRNSEYKRRLPKITKNQALEAARRFVNYVSPDIAEQLSFEGGIDNSNIEFTGDYRFNFYRAVNKIPFYDNSASILVNGQTGEVSNFYISWTEDLKFDDPSKALSLEQAEKIFKEDIGLVLKYKKEYSDEKNRVYMEYSPSLIGENFSIDALTGELVSDSSRIFLYSYETRMKYALYEKGLYGNTGEVRLTDQEAEEARRMGTFMTVEQAENKVREMAEIGINEEYKLNSYSINKQGDSRYIFRMEFMRQMSETDLGMGIPDEKLKILIASGELRENLSVVLDAESGELISVNSYAYSPYGSKGSEKALTREELGKIADGFLEKYKAEKFARVNLQETGDTDGRFVYCRTENGVLFQDNNIIINFDSATGKIKEYYEVWDDIELTPAEGVIGLDKAYEIFFAESGLQLKYINVQIPENTDGSVPVQSGKLVYSFNNIRPAHIDAKSGVLINWFESKPYKEQEKVVFDDIEQHTSKEQIKALAEIGILQGGGSFNPDSPVSQKELLAMISSIKGYTIERMSMTGQKELDGFYRTLINDGILDADERNPDGSVTREKAVKYLLRSAGYKNFAEMKGIFDCPFKDKEQISPGLIGYVTIAKALDITPGEGEYFEPGKEMTKAEAVVMIYDYMKH